LIEVFGKRIEKVGTTQVKSYTTPSELKELLSSLVYEMQVGGDSALCALPLARPPFLFRFGLLDAVSEEHSGNPAARSSPITGPPPFSGHL